jgi:hypothetical protein
MDTRLRDIPPGWIKHVEPNIVRGAHDDCWLWTGKLDSQGRPQFRDKAAGKYSSMRKHIAGLFWACPDNIFVQNACGRQNCVNPSHFKLVERTEPLKGRKGRP